MRRRFAAGFRNAFDIFPPEIERDGDGHRGSSGVHVQMKTKAGVMEKLVDNADEVLSGGNTADRAGKDVVKHQRGNGEFGECAAQRFLYDAIHAAAHEHAAAFHVNSSYRVGKQHDAQDEPGRRLADELLGLATCVIGGRSQVIEDNRRGAPERNESQHGRGGHEDFRNWADATRRECGTRGVGNHTLVRCGNELYVETGPKWKAREHSTCRRVTRSWRRRLHVPKR